MSHRQDAPLDVTGEPSVRAFDRQCGVTHYRSVLAPAITTAENSCSS